MKNQFLYKVFALALVFTVMFQACKNPIEDVDIIVNTDIFKSPVMVHFVNANENSSTAPSDFNVTISGPDADFVVNELGKKSFKAINGVITLALAKGKVANEQNPVTFTVYAEIPGFSPATQTIVLSTDRAAEYTVPVVEYANPAAGTSVSTQSNPVANGVSAAPISITVPTTAALPESASITIPANTEFRDAAGNRISASSVKTNVINYGTGSDAALQAFPGGFNAAGKTFVTGGFVSITMEAGGKSVKQFSKPIEIEIEMRQDLINPVTNATIKVGDIVPIWSLDESKGEWKFEHEVAIIRNSEGKLAARFLADHLSVWTINWTFESCSNPVTLTINMPDPMMKGQYFVRVESSTGQFLAGLHANSSWSAAETLENGFTATIKNVPSIPNAKIAVYTDRFDPNSKVAETPLFNPCSTPQVSLTIGTQPNQAEWIDLDIDLTGKCANAELALNLNAWVTFKEKGAPAREVQNVFITNGKASMRVKNGKTYEISTIYDNKRHSTEFTVDKGNTQLPASKEIKGNLTYNSSTNTLLLNGEIILPNCS